MRKSWLAVGLLAASLAACAPGASPSPRASPVAGAGTGPIQVAPPPSAQPTAVLEVAVTWDGQACTYSGPTVIKDGTLTRFEYIGDNAPLLVIVGVKPGTTWDTIVDVTQTRPASEVPEWVIVTGYANILEDTSSLFTISATLGGMPVGGYFVGCATAPAEDGGTDVMYPAALLEVAAS